MDDQNLLLREDGYPHLPLSGTISTGETMSYEQFRERCAKIADNWGEPILAATIRKLPLPEVKQEPVAFRSMIDGQGHIITNAQALYALPPDAEALRKENEQLRELLCLRSSSSMHLPYMDDGELHDNSAFPHIDYKRDSVAEIISKLRQRTLNELKGE